MKDATAWADKIYALPEVVKFSGRSQMCNKAMKPVVVADVKKEEKKKEAAPVAKKEVKAEKKQDNVEALPPSSWIVYDFKTFFVNHKDKRGAAIDEWYKNLDWDGWSFWFLHYDIYEGEGAKLYITKNLLGGFLSRAEHTAKYSFGRHAVVGEIPDLQIMGVWLMRGQEIPDGMKDHPSFEYYNHRKLDPRNNKADDQLVREFFGGDEDDMMNGLKCQAIKWHK